jgi:hypothetical protein
MRIIEVIFRAWVSVYLLFLFPLSPFLDLVLNTTHNFFVNSHIPEITAENNSAVLIEIDKTYFNYNKIDL